MPNQDVDVEDIYELSPLQQGMLFHCLYEPASTLYFEQTVIPIHLRLNIRIFQAAWQRLLERHSILRTSFHWEDLDKPVQVVHRDVNLPIDQVDLRQLSPAAQKERIAAYLKAERQRGMPFSPAPLLRVGLIRLANDEFRLIWGFHHILLDGWSFQSLNQELWTIYDALVDRQPSELEPSRPYGDYILWLQQQDLGKAEGFWRQALKGFSAPTPLQVDEPLERRGKEEVEYGSLEIKLSKSLSATLQTLARQHRFTLNAVVQAAWAILLSRYSGEQDVVFGSVVSGRPPTLSGVESMVGLFINTLPVRTNVSPEMNVVPWIKELQAQQLLAREYEYSPMLEIQKWSKLPAGVPLFDSIVVFENFPTLFANDPDRDEQDELYLERTNYPLCLVVIPGEEVRLWFYYRQGRFQASAVDRMAGHVRSLLEGIVANPAGRVGELSLLSESERYQILEEWNATGKQYPDRRSLVEMFQAQAAENPRATAFRCQAEKLSYGELNRRANQVAHYLQKLGVGPEVVTGVCLERGLELVVALLGVLKAGGGYLPLDPTYPSERLQYMLADAGAGVLLTEQRFAAMFAGSRARMVWLDAMAGEMQRQSPANLEQPIGPEQLAYVIYTSGSTGKPKGVAVEHQQVLNRMAWMWEAYPFADGEVCCQKTALNFVDSIWELLGGLLRGVPTVILQDAEVKDPYALVERLGQERVSRIWVVPSLLRTLLETHADLEQRLPALRFWVSSGEALSTQLLQEFQRVMPHSVLYNLYGTSEVWDVTWYDPGTRWEQPRVPIGRPISNLQVYVLDGAGRPVPIGVPGELHVGGMGLARGYTGLPELTAAKFVPHPFSNEAGARLYKSGDMVRWREDGNLEFLSRKDHQVKIRGFRVELGEIEAVLNSHPGVRQSIVIAQTNGDLPARLIAYVVTDGTPAPDVRTFLQRKLPEYMLPSALVMLDALPMTSNGKINRRALPSTDEVPGQANELALAFTPPRTPTEELLAKVWTQTLIAKRIGIHDNFFELGGDSILSLQIISRANQAGLRLTPRHLFQHQTIAELAAAAETAATLERDQASSASRAAASVDTHSDFSASTVGAGEVERLIARISSSEGDRK